MSGRKGGSFSDGEGSQQGERAGIDVILGRLAYSPAHTTTGQAALTTLAVPTQKRWAISGSGLGGLNQ